MQSKRDEILKRFKIVDQLLKEKGIKTEVVLVGGAAGIFFVRQG